LRTKLLDFGNIYISKISKVGGILINLDKVDNNNDKNNRKTAVALSFDPEDTAPKIIATGKGQIAERIVERANAADIPIHEDKTLADTLSRLELGSYIPPELYEVVAEILVFVDKMDKIKGKLTS